jgi:hypothetical protein
VVFGVDCTAPGAGSAARSEWETLAIVNASSDARTNVRFFDSAIKASPPMGLSCFTRMPGAGVLNVVVPAYAGT